MFKQDPNVFSFVVDLTGESSGDNYKGKFSSKLLLSHREQLFQDRERRRLLGENPEQASVRAMNQAQVFSELRIRLVETPSWWKDSDGGLDLVDDDVVAGVYAKVKEALEEYELERFKKVEEAKKELEKTDIPTEE